MSESDTGRKNKLFSIDSIGKEGKWNVSDVSETKMEEKEEKISMWREKVMFCMRMF